MCVAYTITKGSLCVIAFSQHSLSESDNNPTGTQQYLSVPLKLSLPASVLQRFKGLVKRKKHKQLVYNRERTSRTTAPSGLQTLAAPNNLPTINYSFFYKRKRQERREKHQNSRQAPGRTLLTKHATSLQDYEDITKKE